MRGGYNRGLAAVTVLLVAAAMVAGSVTRSAPARADVVERAESTAVASVLSGDFTGDGRSDLVLTGASGWNGVAVAAPNNLAGFDVTTVASPAFAAWASLPGVKIVTGDFDGDDADDIILAGVGGWTSLPLARSNRDGSFAVSTVLAGQFAGWAGMPGVRIVTGDFNHDGRTDLALVGGDGWTTVPIAFSTGGGAFTVTNGAAPNLGLPAQADGVRVFGGDFDADGRTDLALLPGGDALLTDDSLTVAFSNGDGSFRVTTASLPDFVSRTDRKTVTAGDVNGDGRTDLVVVLADMILVAYSGGTGGFELGRAGTPDFLALAATPGVRVVGADFDCDGQTDLALVPGTGNAWTTLPVALSRGVETFTTVNDAMPHFPQWAGVAGATVVAGDYNDDGCADLALTGPAGWTSVPFALSDGDGSFTEQNVVSARFAGLAAGGSPVTLPPPPPATLGSLSILDTGAVGQSRPPPPSARTAWASPVTTSPRIPTCGWPTASTPPAPPSPPPTSTPSATSASSPRCGSAGTGCR